MGAYLAVCDCLGKLLQDIYLRRFALNLIIVPVPGRQRERHLGGLVLGVNFSLNV